MGRYKMEIVEFEILQHQNPTQFIHPIKVIAAITAIKNKATLTFTELSS
jgi:hypothetical protein